MMVQPLQNAYKAKFWEFHGRASIFDELLFSIRPENKNQISNFQKLIKQIPKKRERERHC